MDKFKGRPSDYDRRIEKEKAVYELFDSLGIEYELVDHMPAQTMDACEEIESALNVSMCKNLFLRNEQKTRFYLLIMPGDKKFRTKDLSHQINSSRLSFAEAEFMEKYLNITPGSVSITGLMNDVDNNVKFLADADVLANEFIGIHPSINTSSLKIKTVDIKKFIDAVHHDMTVVQL